MTDSESPKRVTFSQQLHDLNEKFSCRPAKLTDILEATEGRGYHLLLVLVSLPFIAPIPLPGLSIPFGLVALLIGARMAIGQKPWLPQKLLRLELPSQLLGKVLKTAGRIVKFLEFFLRPRLSFLQEHFIFRNLAGLLIALSGLYLLLPLPIPFSNALPAWTVLLLAAGTLERDGLFFIAGCVAFVASTAFFAAIAIGGKGLIQHLQHLIFG